MASWGRKSVNPSVDTISGQQHCPSAQEHGGSTLMDLILNLLEDHGALVLFGVGVLEFIGAPIAAGPVLMVAGAMSGMGGLPLPTLVFAAALGGLLSDILWYFSARARGRGILDVVCGLSSNPSACVLGVEKRIRSAGPVYMVFSKLIPGVGNLAAAASGLAGIAFLRFAILDALSLLLWAGVYGGLGWVFFKEVELAVAWAQGIGRTAVLVAVGLIALAGLWRVLKVRMHRPHHAEALKSAGSPSPGEELRDDSRRNTEVGAAELG